MEKGERQILVFGLMNREWGIDLACVREVLRPQAPVALPQAPAFIEGVIHLRGKIVALIDLRKRLFAKPDDDEPNRRIIVCRVKKFTIGLAVSHSKEILALSEEAFFPTPEVVPLPMETEMISGMARIGGRIIPILNLEYLLSQKEITELSALKR